MQTQMADCSAAPALIRRWCPTKSAPAQLLALKLLVCGREYRLCRPRWQRWQWQSHAQHPRFCLAVTLLLRPCRAVPHPWHECRAACRQFPLSTQAFLYQGLVAGSYK